jgi:hypothetical protein
MQWTIVDDLMVCVTSAETPDALTVASFLDDLRTKPVRRILSTPLSVAAEFDAERQACGEICASRDISVAMLVESSLLAAYSSLAGLGATNIAAFSWDDVDAALTHLDLSGSGATQARDALATMRSGGAAIAA